MYIYILFLVEIISLCTPVVNQRNNKSVLTFYRIMYRTLPSGHNLSQYCWPTLSSRFSTGLAGLLRLHSPWESQSIEEHSGFSSHANLQFFRLVYSSLCKFWPCIYLSLTGPFHPQARASGAETEWIPLRLVQPRKEYWQSYSYSILNGWFGAFYLLPHVRKHVLLLLKLSLKYPCVHHNDTKCIVMVTGVP